MVFFLFNINYFCKKTKMRKILLLFTIIGAIVSCDKNEDNDSLKVETFPMSVGTEWTYEVQNILKKYDSDTSYKVTDVDTTNLILRVWIDKDTVLNNNLNVKVFKARRSDFDQTYSQYKYMDNDGLRNYSGVYSGGIDKSISLKSAINFNYYMILKNDLRSKVEAPSESESGLDIKYPLTVNSSWTYKYPSGTDSLQIDKDVTDTETLSLSGQDFPCLKVSWKYLNAPFVDYEVTDWISEKGLIKRKIDYGRIIYIDELDESSLSGQLIVILTLKDVIIK